MVPNKALGKGPEDAGLPLYQLWSVPLRGTGVLCLSYMTSR